MGLPSAPQAPLDHSGALRFPTLRTGRHYGAAVEVERPFGPRSRQRRRSSPRSVPYWQELMLVPDEVAVLQCSLQQSTSWVQELPGSRHDVPPELPPGELPVVTVTVTHSDSHELTTHCP